MASDDPSPLAGLPKRYAVERVLGSGRQKTVYLANDTVLGRAVAIAALQTTAERSQGGLQEARAMAAAGDQPNVVTVYDVIETAGWVYIVARYLSGGDLGTYIQQRGQRLTMPQVLRLGTHIARALEFAHGRGVVHCDVKPGNVFLDDRGGGYLGDFGFATSIAPDDSRALAQINGSPGYLAPELIFGTTRATPSTDLYSFGCLLYELVVGDTPFPDPLVTNVLQHHLHTTPRSPREQIAGVPLPLNDLILALLAKAPAARPATTREVRLILEELSRSFAGGPSPAAIDFDAGGQPAGLARTLPLAGRVQEVAAMNAALASSLRGTPNLLIVSGDPGIGKSRLVQELRGLADMVGMESLLGHGHEDAAVPYRPFVRALLPLASRFTELAPADAALLRSFVYLTAGDEALAVPLIADSDRAALLGTITRALTTFARTRPLLLAIDDLQWADAASLDLLEHLVFSLEDEVRTAPVPLLVVVSTRDIDPLGRAARATARLRRLSSCVAIDLGGLDDGGVYELLGLLGIERASSQLVDLVRGATGGSPLFVRMAVADLKRRQALSLSHGFTICSEPAHVRLPTSIRSALNERLAQLTPVCQRLLGFASFLDRRFQAAELEVLAEVSESEVFDALDEAVRHEQLNDENDGYGFGHDLIRQACYEQWSSARRQRVHLRVAQLHEVGASRGDPVDVQAVAHHLVQSGPAAPPAQVLEAVRRAAHHAFRRFAWRDAATLIELALAAQGTHSRVSVVDLADLHHLAGVAGHRCFDPGPCLQHLDLAISLYRDGGDIEGLARALTDRGRACTEMGLLFLGDEGEIPQLQEALSAVPRDAEALRAQLMGVIAVYHTYARRLPVASAMIREALTLAQRCGDHHGVGQLHLDLGFAQFQSSDLNGAIESYRAGAGYARETHDLANVAKCLQSLAFVLYVSGELAEAEETARAATAASTAAGRSGDATFALLVRASVATVRGDYVAAESLCQELLQIVRRSRFFFTALAVCPLLAHVGAVSGAHVHARTALALMLEPGLALDDPAPLEPSVAHMRRLIDLYADIASASEAPAEAPIFFGQDDSVDPGQLTPVCVALELGVAVTPAIVAALSSAARRGVTFSVGWPFLVDRMHALALARSGDLNSAALLFEQALARAEQLNAWPESARTMMDYAEMLAERDEPGDYAASVRLLKQALPLLERFGPKSAHSRARRCLLRLASGAR